MKKLFSILSLLLCFNINSNEINDKENIKNIILRLDPHIEFLGKLDKNEKINNLFFFRSGMYSILLKCSFDFDDKILITCIQTIKQNNNFDPLINIWNQYKLNNNFTENFIRELTILILVIYKNFLEKLSIDRKFSFTEMLYIYQQTLTLPINQIIDVISLFYERIKNIIDSVETNKNLNFAEWLIENWHIPTAFLAGIITLIITKVNYK